jgi:hypothetical protein
MPTMAVQAIAFAGARRVAAGALDEVALKAKKFVDRGDAVLIFDETTSEPIEIDFRGSPAQVRDRLTQPAADTAAEPKSGPGRPKLGVVSREVTLLPRHWDWLNSQPGGASVALRRLVDEARRLKGGKDRVRQAQERAYSFMHAVAGDFPGFQEASRHLFASDAAKFNAQIAKWPKDVREHVARLAAGAMHGAAS